MSLVVLPAPPVCMAVDSVEDLSSHAAMAELTGRHIEAVALYVDEATPQKLVALTVGGFGVFFVIKSRAPGWMPSAETGTEDGDAAVAKLRALGVPPGACVFLDCESPGAASTAPDRKAHVATASAIVEAAGFLCGAYVGAGYGLSGADWQAFPHLHRYWKGGSRLSTPAGVPGEVLEPMRGWSVIQATPFNQKLGAFNVDFDLLLTDFDGNVVPLLRVA